MTGNVTSVAWGDYNADGQLDFYLGKFYFANELYNNNGDGTFTPVTIWTWEMLAIPMPCFGRTMMAMVMLIYIPSIASKKITYRNDLNADGSFADVGRWRG